MYKYIHVVTGIYTNTSNRKYKVHVGLHVQTWYMVVHALYMCYTDIYTNLHCIQVLTCKFTGHTCIRAYIYVIIILIKMVFVHFPTIFRNIKNRNEFGVKLRRRIRATFKKKTKTKTKNRTYDLVIRTYGLVIRRYSLVILTYDLIISYVRFKIMNSFMC